MGAEELVGRAGVEVGAEVADRHGCVRGEVHAVDEQQRARLVHHGRDAGEVGPGAEQVRRTGDRDEPGARGQHRRVELELRGLGVEVDPAHRHAEGVRDPLPGPDVGVVVEPGDHDLVARLPGLGQGASEVEGQLGHRASEDHTPGVAAEQVRHRGAGLDDDLLGTAFGSGDGAPVGDATGHRGRDGVRDLAGHLGAAGTVEVGRPVAQGREAGTYALDVVVHAAIKPGPRGRSPTRQAAAAVRRRSR